MSFSKPFFISILSHLLILMIGWEIFNALRSHPESKTKIRLTLLPAPSTAVQSISSPPPPLEEEKTLQTPVKSSHAKKPLRKAAIVPPVPHSLAAPETIKPLPDTTLKTITPPEPATLKTTAAEPPIVKMPTTAPPPQQINVQAQYEEENLGRIRALLSERLKYPKNALRLKQQGNVVVAFTLSPSGDISALSISKSSGFELLDDAACDLITTTASAFPRPLKNVRITIPIEYKIR